MKTKAFLFIFSLLFSVTAFAQTSCNFNGHWKTNWDGVTCYLDIWSDGNGGAKGSYSYVLNGSTVTGSLYGTISMDFSDGTDAKYTFKGSWSEGSISGTFEFGRLCSKGVFAGSWWNDNGLESGVWDGVLD